MLLLITALSGCTELQARRRAREGNRHYLEGNYAAALQEYTSAEQLLPTLPVILLNKGLACRQLMLPGAKSKQNDRAIDCALDAFDRLKKLTPDDPRADQLYVQTLFDADRYDALAAMYQRKLDRKPDNLEAINGLIQVYSRADRFEDALRWLQRRAEVRSNDAEAQYAVGVAIWNRLFQKGGSGERASYDPRPGASALPFPPPFGEGDITGAERIRLADVGISYLEKAISIRPNYREAMTYLNLLYRQKSLAFFDRPEEWLAAVEKAESWRKKAMEADPSHKPAGQPTQ